MKRIRTLWENHSGIILGLSAVSVLCLLRFVLGLPCPIKYLTGISCPGCGMTRALWSLVTLDLSAALHYHPACILLPVFAALLILFKVKGMKRATTALLIVFVTLMLGLYVWRLMGGSDGVVICDPQNGLIGRCIRRLMDLLR